MAVVQDAAWFNKTYGLRDFGEDVLGLCRKETSKSKICEVFGPMSSKSGWKFKNYTTPAVAAQIVDLYRKVYDTDEVTNNEIPQKFARALVVESDPNRKVNWAAFAAHSKLHRAQVAQTKLSNLEVKVESRSCGQSVRSWEVGSKRLPLADMKENLPPFPNAVKVGSGGMGLRGKSMLKGGLLPHWEDGEVLGMQLVLEEKKKYLKVLKVSLEESLQRKAGIEGELRRARLEFSDRQVMHQMSVQNVEKQKSMTLLLAQQIERDDVALSQFRVSNHIDVGLAGKMGSLEETLERRKKEHERVLFALSMEEKTEKHYLQMLENCRLEKESLEKSFEQCQKCFEGISGKVECMEQVLKSMGEQFQRMQEGLGVTSYPRPIGDDPVEPIQTVCTLNACPVCGYWYKISNHAFAPCGHAYHPWCLYTIAESQTSCVFPLCDVSFSTEWYAAWGVRQGVATSNQDGKVKDQGCIKKEKTAAAKKTITKLTDVAKEGQQLKESKLTQMTFSFSEGAHSEQHLKSPITSSQDSANTLSENLTNTNCQVCNKNQASITLDNCGHNLFCYSCVKGMKACPICDEHITTWKKAETRPVVNPLVLSLGGAFDAEVDPLLPKPKKSTKKVDIKLNNDEGLGYFPEGASDDSDEEGSGRIEWCSDDLFERGFGRTVVATTEDNTATNPEIELEHPPITASDDFSEEAFNGNVEKEGVEEGPSNIEAGVVASKRPNKTTKKRLSTILAAPDCDEPLKKRLVPMSVVLVSAASAKIPSTEIPATMASGARASSKAASANSKASAASMKVTRSKSGGGTLQHRVSSRLRNPADRMDL